MVEMEIKLISTETIKPSSPTPKYLQKHHLSFIDQGIPPVFMPMIYFYSSINPEIPYPQKSEHLKKSLSESLSIFYPLGGRLVGNLYVDCNDAGATFTEAQAKCDLAQAISDPNSDTFTQFLPYEIAQSRNLLLAVQATFFRCGGLALGLLVSHKIGDACSLFMFANAWSTVARNGHSGGLPLPKFDGAAYFPPQDVSDPFNKEIFNEETVTRVFTFSTPQISLLREKYGGWRRPSRVEALTAHIWTRLLAATGMQSDPNKISQTVNLRNRVNEPPLTEYHFGNFFGVSVAAAGGGDGGVELVRKIHEANKSCSSTFMDLLECASEKRVNWCEEFISQHLTIFSFSSLTGFPIYEADVGWGKQHQIPYSM